MSMPPTEKCKQQDFFHFELLRALFAFDGNAIQSAPMRWQLDLIATLGETCD